MRGKTIRFLGQILICFILAMGFSGRVCAAGAWLADDAGVLSGDEAARLSSQLQEYSRDLNFDIVVITVNNLSSGDAATEGMALYRQKGMGLAGGDAAVLLISVESREGEGTTVTIVIPVRDDEVNR